MSEEGSRFRVSDSERLVLRPVESGGCEWELSFETPQGEQITIELPSKACHELLVSIRKNVDSFRDKDSLSPNERTERADRSNDTEGGLGLLPEDSTLRVQDYLLMHRALGNRTRYEILWLLVQEGEMSLDAIEQKLSVNDPERVADHVETLCDVFLTERWEQTERGSTGTATTYRPTVFGRVALTDGIHELIRGERGFSEMYGGNDDEADEEA